MGIVLPESIAKCLGNRGLAINHLKGGMDIWDGGDERMGVEIKHFEPIDMHEIGHRGVLNYFNTKFEIGGQHNIFWRVINRKIDETSQRPIYSLGGKSDVLDEYEPSIVYISKEHVHEYYYDGDNAEKAEECALAYLNDAVEEYNAVKNGSIYRLTLEPNNGCDSAAYRVYVDSIICYNSKDQVKEACTELLIGLKNWSHHRANNTVRIVMLAGAVDCGESQAFFKAVKKEYGVELVISDVFEYSDGSAEHNDWIEVCLDFLVGFNKIVGYNPMILEVMFEYLKTAEVKGNHHMMMLDAVMSKDYQSWPRDMILALMHAFGQAAKNSGDFNWLHFTQIRKTPSCIEELTADYDINKKEIAIAIFNIFGDWEGFSEALADSNNANEFSDNFFINLSDHESHMVFFKERRGRLIKMAKAYWDSQTNKGLVIRIFNRVLRDRGSIELDDVARVLFQPIYEMDSDAESRIEVIECVASALIRECVEIIHKDHK